MRVFRAASHEHEVNCEVIREGVCRYQVDGSRDVVDLSLDDKSRSAEASELRHIRANHIALGCVPVKCWCAARES